VIGLHAINCATGEALVNQQIEAARKENVLKALGSAATEMRSKQLGESLTSVHKFATPIEEATTSSLEALKTYSIARKVLRERGDAEAIPYYERTVELDRNFALAYSSLGIAYFNTGQTTRAIGSARKAFELRDRVSEREKYRISAAYYTYVTGELAKAIQTYELWRQSYPHDVIPPVNLGDIYTKTGQWEKALREAQDGKRLESSAVVEGSLAQIQLAVEQTDEARATVQQALARQWDSTDLRIALYGAAFLRNDQDTMRAQLDWAAGLVAFDPMQHRGILRPACKGAGAFTTVGASGIAWQCQRDRRNVAGELRALGSAIRQPGFFSSRCHGCTGADARETHQERCGSVACAGRGFGRRKKNR
jgi:tetratricopeptide (TPR) repeat protein